MFLYGYFEKVFTFRTSLVHIINGKPIYSKYIEVLVLRYFRTLYITLHSMSQEDYVDMRVPPLWEDDAVHIHSSS